jgi:hypothetical protein
MGAMLQRRLFMKAPNVIVPSAANHRIEMANFYRQKLLRSINLAAAQTRLSIELTKSRVFDHLSINDQKNFHAMIALGLDRLVKIHSEFAAGTYHLRLGSYGKNMNLIS